MGARKIIYRLDQDTTYVKGIARVPRRAVGLRRLAPDRLAFPEMLMAKPVIGAKAYCHSGPSLPGRDSSIKRTSGSVPWAKQNRAPSWTSEPGFPYRANGLVSRRSLFQVLPRKSVRPRKFRPKLTHLPEPLLGGLSRLGGVGHGLERDAAFGWAPNASID